MSNEFYIIGGSASNSGTSSAAACSSSRWLTEEVFKLIDIVQRDEAIYNPRHKYYFCRPYVENFWREVDLKLEKNPGASLAKWTNLRISFRREYTNYVEEKVPPCWSYFDRMFFLHPYLRKKHQQPKSLDSQVQDALVQISSLSNRLQRERVAAAAAAATTTSAVTNNSANGINPNRNNTTQQQRNHDDSTNSHCYVDSYLDYFEDDAPNNSELDEIIDDDEHHREQQSQQQHSRLQRLEAHSLNNDIKSECEENNDDDDYDDQRAINAHNRMTPLQDEEPEIDDDADIGRNYVINDFPNVQRKTHENIQQQQQQQQLQHQQQLQRLQIQRSTAYHSDTRPTLTDNKRVRLEAVTENALNLESVTHTGTMQQRIVNSNTANVSFVRPTFSKSFEMVSTTSGIQASISGAIADAVSVESDASTSAAVISSSSVHLRHQHPHRSNDISTNVDRVERVGGPHYDLLCDCKTDPDAMFLMSLLPDIQKLNGRDRGKIKIAFQNILQDFLYPD